MTPIVVAVTLMPALVAWLALSTQQHRVGVDALMLRTYGSVWQFNLN